MKLILILMQYIIDGSYHIVKGQRVKDWSAITGILIAIIVIAGVTLILPIWLIQNNHITGALFLGAVFLFGLLVAAEFPESPFHSTVCQQIQQSRCPAKVQ